MPSKVRLRQAAEVLGIPEATLRDIRFKAAPRFAASGQLVPGNGFAAAFHTLGRAVYVDTQEFQEIWADLQKPRSQN